jgi:hypothetical protein
MFHRCKSSGVAPLVVLCFVATSAVPRDAQYVHRHEAGDHRHVHPWDDARALAHEAQHTHQHEDAHHHHEADHRHRKADPRQEMPPDRALETNHRDDLAHAHLQGPLLVTRSMPPRIELVHIVAPFAAAPVVLSADPGVRTRHARSPPRSALV